MTTSRPEFQGRDLSDAEFWGVDLSRSSFRDVDFTGVAMHNVWMVDVEIDGLVDRLVVNGVDVTAHVDAHDPWQPLRGMLRPTDGAGLVATWNELERVWASMIREVADLPRERQHASVDSEWSFVQTLRHLVFVIDKWFIVPIAGGSFHPAGLPNTGSADRDWPGLDANATPSLDDACAARTDRATRFADFLATFTDDDVSRTVEVIENGTEAVIACVYTVFEEAFEHYRYARRDLDRLN